MNQFWWIAFKNLNRNLKRNIATGSAIALGFAGILILGGYANRVTNYLRVYTVYSIHTGHLVLFKKEGLQKNSFKPKKYSLTMEDQNKIDEVLREHPNVEFFEKQIKAAGLIGNGCKSVPFFAQGVEPEIERKIRNHKEVLRWMPQQSYYLKGQGLWNYSSDLGAVALSPGLVRSLSKSNVHDDVKDNPINIINCDEIRSKEEFAKDANTQLVVSTWLGSMGALDAEVVAHYTTGFIETDNSAILASTKYLQKLYETDQVAQYAIFLKDPNQINQTFNEIKSQIGDDKFDLYKWSEETLSPYYTGTIEFLDSMVSFIGIVLSLIIIFSVLNSTTMTILERSQEIGMYRAIGFKRSQIRGLFVKEAFWLTLISLFVGGVLAFITIYLINAAKITYNPPGAAKGFYLVLILAFSFLMYSGFFILILTLATTAVAVYGQLKKEIVMLLGGANR